jgi:hypothetical protein
MDQAIHSESETRRSSWFLTKELPVWLQTITMLALFAFSIIVGRAVESKRGDGRFLQANRIYSIVYFVFPLIIVFLGCRFFQSMAKKFANRTATGGVVEGFCFIVIALTTTIAFLGLLVGLPIFLDFLLSGEHAIRE